MFEIERYTDAQAGEWNAFVRSSKNGTFLFDRGYMDYLIAVSDGAGGGGLFAERWSAYLLSHLPATPINSAEELAFWIGENWELLKYRSINMGYRKRYGV